MNIKCHACARVWEIEDDAMHAQCAYCGRAHDGDMINASRLDELKSKAAALLGSVKTLKKSISSRENGKKGGAPKGQARAPKGYMIKETKRAFYAFFSDASNISGYKFVGEYANRAEAIDACKAHAAAK